jgi:hypothetical protein
MLLDPYLFHIVSAASRRCGYPGLTRLGLRYRLLSAFLRSHREEFGGLLMHVFPAAFRAPDLALLVFRKGEDDLEGLLAVFAEELVARHGDLQSRTGIISLYAAAGQ